MNKIFKKFDIACAESAYEFMQPWFNKYNYVLSVLIGNKKSKNIEHEKISIKWAQKVLEQEFYYLISKHVLFRRRMKIIYYDYMYKLLDIHYEVLNGIEDNKFN